MKFIKKFSSMAEYEAADLSYPATSLVSGTVIYDKELTPQYRTLTTATTCVGFDKYTLEEYQVSMDRGKTWTTTGTSATTLIEADSEDCGYVPVSSPKWIATYSDSHTSSAECGSSSAITAGEITLTDLVSVEIGDCVTSIGVFAFTQCTSLESVIIGNGVTTIDYSAFADCSSLTSVTIGSGVTSIDSEAFGNCPSLSSITVDSNNTVYDSRNNCNAIIETSTNTLKLGCKNTVIPNTVVNIGDNAFASCSSLTSVTIPSSVTSIGNGAFQQCSGLANITIPDSVTSIDEAAFLGCSSLTSIDIPSGVTSIGNNTFSNCTSLTSVNIPSGVTNIDMNAFYYCSSLTSINIPSGVTSIGDGAFQDCSGLTSVTVRATTPPALGLSVFDNTNDCPILVPAQSVSAYQSPRGWYYYGNRIQAIA